MINCDLLQTGGKIL